jgi:hypothetical protein
MAKKCLKHEHFAERDLPAIMGANLSPVRWIVGLPPVGGADILQSFGVK